MQLIFPALYGVYVSLCLLILQPLQTIGLSPLGALCLVIMGYGLVGFISSAVSLPSLSGVLYLPARVLGPIAGSALLYVLGIGAFVTGTLAGSSFLFTVISIIYGQIVGTVWYRFRSAQGFPLVSRVGIAAASLAVALVYLFDWVGLSGGWVPAGDRQWAVRALVLLGAMIWGASQNSFVAREQSLSRGKWLFWESVISVSLVCFLAGLAQAVALSSHVVSAGFAAEPLLMFPFVLFGVVLGGLKHRLVHVWEPVMGSGLVSGLWVSALVITATVSLVALKIGWDVTGGRVFVDGLPTVRPAVAAELLAMGVVGMVLVLIRNARTPVTGYAGPQPLRAVAAVQKGIG